MTFYPQQRKKKPEVIHSMRFTQSVFFFVGDMKLLELLFYI